MKIHHITLLLGLLFIQSCNSQQAEKSIQEQIGEIEHHLVPAVIIEGEDIGYLSLKERMSFYNVPGVSIAYIDKGRLQWSKGYGYISFDSTWNVDENTLFQAASISKPVAALMALKLVEEGKLDLDRNVNDYLANWKLEENEYTAEQPVTLRGLLTHSAGLTVHGFRGYAHDEDIPTIIQVLNGEKPANSDRIRPDTIPGSINRYSGGGYTVMQKLLEDVTGVAFPDLLKENILDVIGMENSSYDQPLPKNRYEMASIGHRSDGKKVDGNWHTYPEMAAAGLWTTPTDLAKYMLEVQKSYQGKSNKILSREMTIEMLRKQIDRQGLGPGLGESEDTLTFGHGGANEGYRCQIFAYAESGPGIAVMTNSDNGGGLVQEIIRGFSDYYNWSTYKAATRTRITMAPEVLEKFAGKYKMDKDYKISISAGDNQLVCIQEWDDFEFTIIPSSELIFFNLDDNAGFEFELDEKGDISGVLILGQYNFKKN